MLHSHCHHHLFPNLHVPLSLTNHNSSLYLPLPSPLLHHFLHKPTILHSVSATPPATSPWLTHIAKLTTATVEGPIELPFSTPSVFATTDDPSTIQVASSVLLTGAITILLFLSLRRRAKHAKKFRSSGVKKPLKKEALDSMKAVGSTSVAAKGPPSPLQALFGAIYAGVIALILYKFTTP